MMVYFLPLPVFDTGVAFTMDPANVGMCGHLGQDFLSV
jgi:hypothetical protein